MLRRRQRTVTIAAVAAGLLVGACGFVTGGGEAAGTKHFTAYFTRTISLYPQSDVRILGLHAGRVRRIKVVGTHVRVDFTLEPDTPIPTDVHATIVPLSLIGERYLQLHPAWTGGSQLADHSTIPLERTTVPVEPDEALASLKNLLEDLNPDGAHRLVSNLAEDLAGKGDTLNDALHQFAGLTSTLAAKADDIGRIVDNFDQFTATLVSRERALGQVMDDFATLTSTLADERAHVQGLVHNLATLASDTRDLVATHRAGLDRDLTTLAKVAKTIDANLDTSFHTIQDLLDAGPLLAQGLQSAYNPAYHRIDLRNSFSETAAQAVTAALGPLLPSAPTIICLPADVSCTPTPAAAPAPAGRAEAKPQADPAASAPPTTGTTIVPAPSDPNAELSDLVRGLTAGPSHRKARSSAVPKLGPLGVMRGAVHGLASIVNGVLR